MTRAPAAEAQGSVVPCYMPGLHLAPGLILSWLCNLGQVM